VIPEQQLDLSKDELCNVLEPYRASYPAGADAVLADPRCIGVPLPVCRRRPRNHPPGSVTAGTRYPNSTSPPGVDVQTSPGTDPAKSPPRC
jgi:hypothetical protein